MYRKGYFRQRVDAVGWQHEYWIETDPERLPAALVTGADSQPLTITVPIADQDVAARIWRVDVGRVALYLLDTDCDQNGPLDRWITARLYDGDPQTRLAQYAMLGVGGIRALRAMGFEPSVIHLNEGHAALAPLELARGDGGLDATLARARERTVFTTHTPVPAGNDTYPPGQIEAAVGRFAGDLGCSIQELIAIGHNGAVEHTAPFGVTQAALADEPRGQRRQPPPRRGRAGDVELAVARPPARRRPDRPRHQRRARAHLDRALPMRELLDRYLPAGWIDHAADPAVWTAVDEIPAAELWEVRCASAPS